MDSCRRTLLLTACAIAAFTAAAAGAAKADPPTSPDAADNVNASEPVWAAAFAARRADEAAGEAVAAARGARAAAVANGSDPVLVDFSELGPELGLGYRLTVSWSGWTTVDDLTRGNGWKTSFALSARKLAQLKAALEQARFRSLRSRYTSAYWCPDCASYSITFGGRAMMLQRFTYLDFQLLPRRLRCVISLVERLLDARLAVAG
jgi:hypothetical protein